MQISLNIIDIMSIMFNEICINEEMLPKYIYIYIVQSNGDSNSVKPS